MSALFQHGQRNELTSVEVDRNPEIRDIPSLFAVHLESDIDNSFEIVISSLFTQLPTNWLYSSTLQSALNARQPFWSRDGWSFVPLEIQNLAADRISQQVRTSLFQPTVNITLKTPAIRARLICNPYEGLENHTEWLTYVNTTNPSIWNQSTILQDVNRAYSLGAHFFNTSFLARPGDISCCSNGTDDATGSVALGYWSLDSDVDDSATGPLTISIKWVYGHGTFQTETPEDPRLLFSAVPAIAAIRCIPEIEVSDANVTVNGVTGEVQSFAILSKSIKNDGAWKEAFVERDGNGFSWNVTARQEPLIIPISNALMLTGKIS